MTHGLWESAERINGRDLYVVRGTNLQRVKIGCANDVPKRIAALRTGSPDTLVLVGSVSGAGHLEKFLHRHYAADRVQGEWFGGRAFEELSNCADIAAKVRSIVASAQAVPASCDAGAPTGETRQYGGRTRRILREVDAPLTRASALDQLRRHSPNDASKAEVQDDDFAIGAVKTLANIRIDELEAFGHRTLAEQIRAGEHRYDLDYITGALTRIRGDAERERLDAAVKQARREMLARRTKA